MKLTVLGCGYSGCAIVHAVRLAVPEADVVGTRRSAAGVAALEQAGIAALALDGVPSAAVLDRLARTTHLISSVAPARVPPLDDPMLSLVAGAAAAGRLPALRWIGYLSSIGVYGDHAGEPIDEAAPCRSQQVRSRMRLEAEDRWRRLAVDSGVPLAVLRLAGIYGPGRNALRDALDGRARILDKPGQVFNRIHVEDLARATAIAARRRVDDTLNISDDEPAPPGDVVRFAHALLERVAPTPIAFDDAELSPMARSFYAENKRIDNRRSKSVLGLSYVNATYREGLTGLLAHERDAQASD